jgi:flagellar hook-associated protein 2
LGISFGGINTGLPPNIVDQLVEVERAPIKSLEARKTKEKNRLELVNELDTKIRGINDSLKELANSGGFQSIKLATGDATIIDGVVDPKEAVKGSWSIEIMELPQKAAAISNGFPDKDKTELGVGYFKFETPEGTKEVYLNGSSNTLDAAAKAINAAELGLQASVIKDMRYPDAPFRLVVSGTSLGDQNNVNYPTLYFLDGDQDFYFDDTRGSKNGKIKVDGIEFEVSENQIKDIIPGVTLDIKQAAAGRPVNISVKEDREVVSGKIKSFVDTTNAVLSFIQGQNKLDEKSDTSKTLGGDGLLRSVEQKFHKLIQNPQYGVQGRYNMLNQLGIRFARSGLLEFDQDKFNSALAADPDSVRKFFTGDGLDTGFIPALKQTINSLTDSGFGPVTNRKRGIENNMKRMDDRIETMVRQVERKEQALRRQFATLETTMNKIKSQGAYLQQGGGLGFSLGGQSGGG